MFAASFNSSGDREMAPSFTDRMGNARRYSVGYCIKALDHTTFWGKANKIFNMDDTRICPRTPGCLSPSGARYVSSLTRRWTAFHCFLTTNGESVEMRRERSLLIQLARRIQQQQRRRQIFAGPTPSALIGPGFLVRTDELCYSSGCNFADESTQRGVSI